MKRLEGRIKTTGKGVGFFPNPDNIKESFEIQPELMQTALHGDTVEIELLGRLVYSRPQAKVVRVIERGKLDFVGMYESGNEGGFVVPDDKHMYRDIFIPAGRNQHATDGDKVQAHITSWENASKSPTGEIIRVIGRKGEHNAEMQAIVYEAGFEIGFPPEVEAEAEAWKQAFRNEDHLANGRRDLRGTLTFTIDPADAKDFDDAISFRRLESGRYEIGVHIADVSHFVLPGTALDKEAAKRGTSIYLVDRTIPMLPEILSNDLCSLNPNEDKYAFSAVFEMNANGEVLERWFGRTLINSDKRFTYEEAQAILDQRSGLYYEELDTLNRIAYKLREQKFAAGAIEFEQDEVRFELDTEGHPIRVYRKVRKDTHKLVEDYMLLANREVAVVLHTASRENPKAAGVYRIHDAPDRERIANLATFVKALGFHLEEKDGETTAENISKMLRSVDGTPAETLIKTAAIRAMSKAVYSTANIGHFGLAFEFYTHFTSPIRRYPDLLVHRLLYRHLTGGEIEQDEIVRYERLSAEASEREAEAAEAERASIKYKQVEYMEHRVGTVFDAVISGISEWGLYVEEAESKAEGLVRLRDMTDDFYELDEKNYAVVGKKFGKKYSLGDKVRVRLIAADLERKTLDFQFVAE